MMNMESGQVKKKQRHRTPAPPSSSVTWWTWWSTRSLCTRVSLLLLSFSVIFLPIVFTVILPAFVRHLVASSNLLFKKMTIKSPYAYSGKGGDSVGSTVGTFAVQLDATVSDTGGLAANIDADQLNVLLDGEIVMFMQPIPTIAIAAAPSTDVKLVSTVQVNNKTKFDAFVADLLKSKTLDWSVSSHVTLSVPLLAGMAFDNVPWTKHMTIDGMNNLNGTVLTGFDIVGATPLGLVANITVEMHNPSTFEMRPFGYFSLQVVGVDGMGNEGTMGTADHEDLTIAAGVSVVNFVGQLRPGENQAVMQNAIDNYVGRRDTDIDARAFQNTTSNELFLSGMQALSLPLVLPGLNMDLINWFEMDVVGFATIIMRAPSWANVNNPFGVDMEIYSADLIIEYRGKRQDEEIDIADFRGMNLIGTVDARQAATIPPGSGWSVQLRGSAISSGVLGDLGIRGENAGVGAFTYVSIRGKLVARLGGEDGYLQEVNYRQENILAVNEGTDVCVVAVDYDLGVDARPAFCEV